VAETKPISEPVKTADSKPKLTAVATPIDTSKPTIALETLKRRPLHFVFSDDTWAEVIDANGAVLLSRKNTGGSEQWIGGPRRAPYAVSISRPGNVRLFYKGKEIDLSGYPAKEIARLKVE